MLDTAKYLTFLAVSSTSGEVAFHCHIFGQRFSTYSIVVSNKAQFVCMNHRLLRKDPLSHSTSAPITRPLHSPFEAHQTTHTILPPTFYPTLPPNSGFESPLLLPPACVRLFSTVQRACCHPEHGHLTLQSQNESMFLPMPLSVSYAFSYYARSSIRCFRSGDTFFEPCIVFLLCVASKPSY